MGVAALISWLVTAFFGLYLLAVWLIENDVTHRGATASRLPAPVIFGHVLLALGGLVCWVIHLLSGSGAAGWAAVGVWAALPRLG
jgi:predicted transporter